MFDPSAIAARELLSYFGKNTAVRIDHRYGKNVMYVVVARTARILATISLDDSLAMEHVDYSRTAGDHYTVHPANLEFVANSIKTNKGFPRPRNMKRAWSPIRLSERAKAEAEIMKATIGGYYMNVDPA